jgi:hypothetical protein
MSGARLIHTFAMNLYPVIGGKDYHVAILIGHFDGAGTITLPSSDTNAYIADASNNGDIWESGQDSSGTITINASGGGSLDLKDLKAMLSGSTVDELKVSWTC